MINIKFTNDINNLIFKEIYKNVIIYSNMLPDPEKAYKTIANSEALSNGIGWLQAWEPWAEFGTYTQVKYGEQFNNSIPGKAFDDEKELEYQIIAAYNQAISHYVDYTKIKLPTDAHLTGNSYCKYFDQIDTLKNNMTMQYHTDYIISQREMPGPKFHTTCTFYINDDYEGGDLEFFIDGNIINYKPKAGDIVIFPSTEPFYHGVKQIFNGNKYFIRNFIMTTYDGSPEWLKKQKEYGAYRWSKKEWERIEKEDDENMLYFSNGKKITFDEAQEIRSKKLAEKNTDNE